MAAAVVACSGSLRYNCPSRSTRSSSRPLSARPESRPCGDCMSVWCLRASRRRCPGRNRPRPGLRPCAPFASALPGGRDASSRWAYASCSAAVEERSRGRHLGGARSRPRSPSPPSDSSSASTNSPSASASGNCACHLPGDRADRRSGIPRSTTRIAAGSWRAARPACASGPSDDCSRGRLHPRHAPAGATSRSISRVRTSASLGSARRRRDDLPVVQQDDRRNRAAANTWAAIGS